MSLVSKVVQVTQPTSPNASFAVTGVGFQPKVIILFAVEKTADGNAININDYHGMATSTTNRVALSTGASSSVTDERYHDNTKCFVVTSIAGAVLVAADLVSFDADGFTLNFSTVDGNARKINVLCLGGSDITNAMILKFDQAAGTGDQAVTGVGFQPDALIFMSPSTGTAPPGGDTNSGGDTILSFADTALNTLAFGADTADGNLLTAKFISRPSGGNLSTFRYQGTLKSYDSDGFTINWTAASNRIGYVLCLKGGSYKVGVFNFPTSTGAFSRTGIGFLPTGVIFLTQGAVTSSAVQQLARRFSVGMASSSSSRGAIWHGSDNTNLNQRLAQTKVIVIATPGAAGSPTLVADADFTSFDTDGFTLNASNADATAREIGYMAFGPTLLAPSVTTNAATAITPTTATGNGDVTSDGGSAITERGIVWGTSANPTTAGNKVTAAGTTGAFTGAITSLSPSTLYHFRAYAINAIGTTYGADTTFTSSAGSSIVAPTVVTQAPTSITSISALAGATITDTGGENDVTVGFEYSTTPSPDNMISQSGSFGAGLFTQTMPSLLPSTVYYVRGFATNSAGTGYGSYVSFTTASVSYSITIAGVDRTLDVINFTPQVSDILNDQQNTCTFDVIDRSGNGVPSTNQEVIITLPDGTRLFGGYITHTEIGSLKDTGRVKTTIQCVDYVRLLDRNLVNAGFTGMTDKAIIESIVATYCPGFGITTANVLSGVTIDQITFDYVQPSQALRRIADLTGRNWYIDYYKDIHYFPLTTNAAPFNITDAVQQEYSGLHISKDATQLKNRVYVRGGTRLSDPTTFSQKGDGTQRKFVVPDKPHAVSLTVNGVSKTLGIKNIDAAGSKQWYLNFEEKYVEQDTLETVLSTTDVLVVTYTYDIPILVAVEDTESIIENGQYEFRIIDKTITTTQAARDRAAAELTDYANNLIEGGFTTTTPGFRSGQYLTINKIDYGINAQYIIQSVQAFALGAGKYYYQVSIASAKTMGIIRFLIELLEANNRQVQVSDQEVVDNLLSIADSLNSDSLTDLMTIDSAGAYNTWCTDSLQSSPTTRARWDLFQWG